MSGRRAFVSDFDGTLYHHEASGIGGGDAATIAAFRASGGLFGVSSSRAPRAIELQSSGTDFDFMVAVGGALVIDGAGKPILQRRIPYDAVAWLQGTYANAATAVVIAADRDLYAIGGVGTHFVRSVASLADLPTSLYGVSIATRFAADAARIAQGVNDALAGVAHATQNVTGVDVVADGCSKASALAELRRALDISTLAAMADAENDLGLLESADVAYVPIGASSAMAGVADMTVANVAEALDDFVKRQTLMPAPPILV